MKGIYRLKVLDFLSNTAQLADDIFFIFTLPYGTSYSRMMYLLEKRKEQGKVKKSNVAERRRFNDFLFRLKKDGLITCAEENKKRLLQLTPKGRRILEKLRLTKSGILPAVKYGKQKDDTLKIIIFDIPEAERKKRNWLRSALTNLKFQMLQKSVWVGKTSLPEKFLADLDKVKILDYVEIFAITKTGTLKQLKNT